MRPPSACEVEHPPPRRSGARPHQGAQRCTPHLLVRRAIRSNTFRDSRCVFRLHRGRSTLTKCQVEFTAAESAWHLSTYVRHATVEICGILLSLECVRWAGWVWSVQVSMRQLLGRCGRLRDGKVHIGYRWRVGWFVLLRSQLDKIPDLLCRFATKEREWPLFAVPSTVSHNCRDPQSYINLYTK